MLPVKSSSVIVIMKVSFCKLSACVQDGRPSSVIFWSLAMVNPSKLQMPGDLSSAVLGLSHGCNVGFLNSLCVCYLLLTLFVLLAYEEIAGQPIQVRNNSTTV